MDPSAAKRAAEIPGFAAQVVAGEKNEKYAGPCKKKGICFQTLIMEESSFRGQGLGDLIHLCAARAHDHPGGMPEFPTWTTKDFKSFWNQTISAAVVKGQAKMHREAMAKLQRRLSA